VSLREPVEHGRLRVRRDRMLEAAEGRLLEASSGAVRGLLARMRQATRPKALQALTAAGSFKRSVFLFGLGQVQGWWAESVDEHLAAEVDRVWRVGYFDTRDGVLEFSSLQAAADHLAHVRDRLVYTAQPTIAEGAFDAARVALSEEMAAGSSVDTMARRLAAEFSWDADYGFWEGRLAATTARLDALLDGYGPPGSAARLAVQQGLVADVRVSDLQDVRARLVRLMGADRTVWQTRAARIARTEATAAYNAGALEAGLREGAGVKVWLATGDPRTRDAHLEAHSLCVPVREPFQVGGVKMAMPGDPSAPPHLTVNCRAVLPGSRVRGAVAVAMRREWSGPVKVVATAGGHELSATPEHPVLTLRGWVRADEVEVGDQVVGDGVDGEGAGRPADGPHVDDLPPTIEEVYEAATFAATGGQGAGLCRAVEFDQDTGAEVEVDVVVLNHVLAVGVDSTEAERLSHLGALLSHREVCASRDEATLVRVSHPGVAGLRAVAGVVAGGVQPAGDGGAGQPGGTGQSEDRFAALMALGEFGDEVVAVRDGWWDGHVYDLATVGGLWSANGLTVHNCTMVFADDCRQAGRLYGFADGVVDAERDRRGVEAAEALSVPLAASTATFHQSHDQKSHGNWARGRRFDSPEQARKWAMETWPSVYDGAEYPADATSAVEHYQGNPDPINNRLRQGLPPYPENVAHIAALDRTMGEHPLPEPVTMYRGLSRDAYRKLQEDAGTDQWLEGVEFSQPGYTSTSLDERQATFFTETGGVVLELEVPEGTPALFLNAVSNPPSQTVLDHELEVLLPREVRIEVQGDAGRRLLPFYGGDAVVVLTARVVLDDE
jgi:hypothetical protein